MRGRSTLAQGGVAGYAAPTSRWYVPLVLGVGAALLLLVGTGGVGDAPSPQGTAAQVQAHFLAVKEDVLLSAPFGYLGAAALVLFAVHVGRRLAAADERGAAVAVVVGGVVTAAYHLGLHVTYTTLAYEVAATSAEATKALFVATILAVPVLGGGVALMLGGFAYGAQRAGAAPRWLVVVSAVGAAVAAVALVAYAGSDYFSPDVQQQFASGVSLVWLLLAGGALASRSRREAASGRR